uniref:LITAF domain-containing protein n=1 Tax=Clastoptera arizonana TaxID=38151 RepID=A0A1B6EBM5_9HEMI
MEYKPNAPPPAYGMHVPQPQPQVLYPTQVAYPVQQRPTIIPMAFGPNSAATQCPSCHASISTKTVKSATTKTHILALVLCLICCWPCVILPYCTDSCRATNHYCPNCNAFLGSFDQ